MHDIATVRRCIFTLAVVAIAALWAATGHAARAAQDPRTVARGEYLVQIAGCNDCHTAEYPQRAGKVAQSEWLKGDKLGWRGPWGTTYATNLRLLMPRMTQKQWLVHARTMQPRPPMPWFNVRAMSDQDLIAIYLFVKSLGPAGDPAPAYVPPGQAPSGPHIQFPQ